MKFVDLAATADFAMITVSRSERSGPSGGGKDRRRIVDAENVSAGRLLHLRPGFSQQNSLDCLQGVNRAMRIKHTSSKSPIHGCQDAVHALRRPGVRIATGRNTQGVESMCP